MDEELSSDMQKDLSDGVMDTDEGPLINENSNGLSHLLMEGEYNSVVDDSSASNPGFLNAVELSESGVGDYLGNEEAGGFNTDFDVGDNAVNFPSDSLNTVLSDVESHHSDSVFKAEITESGTSKIGTDTDHSHQGSESETFTAELSDDKSSDHLVADDVQEPVRMEENSSAQEKSEETNEMELEIKQAEVSEEVTMNDEVKPADNVKEEEEVINDDSKEQEVGGAEETEVVSEDELPAVEKPRVKDAENVSDDELPGPKPAELPADTEVVSEDELPASKKDTKDTRKRKNEDKDGYDPGSPTSESENKKQAVEKNGESKPVPAEKRLSTDEAPKKKTLPELDKYWKVVNEDPTDFTGWTYLLQYVDQESDVEAAREAYDAFLSHYPYCYGYWRKYADYEKRKGSKKKCLEVLERGLKAIPLSVDLWIHYLNHIKTTRTEDHAYIRSQYERAIEACGLEFRSDRLWESYIKWEAENGTALHVTQIYDRLLATPTLGYTSHFDSFQEHVRSEPVSGLVTRDELIRLREEVRAVKGGAPPALDLPPGEDEPPDHIASDEEGQAIKERIIAVRRKVHKTTGEEVTSRWTFEEGIKRPYFHVKPLERCQLKNWKAYLEWEKQHGSFRRALVLHERCLIACALYEEFWMKLFKFLEEHAASQPELVTMQREVLERACTVHHLDKPDLHLHWAHFEESLGNLPRAAEILERIEKAVPNLVQIQYRRVNLERRRGDLDKCAQLYESYISSAKSKPVASALAIKYARFLFHVKKDHAGARRVLDEAIVKEPLNQRLHMQRLDIALHTPDTPFEELDDLAQSYGRAEGAEPEWCAVLAWRRRELAEELGDAKAAHAAVAAQRVLQRHLRKRARTHKHEAAAAETAAVSETKKKDPPTSTNASANSTPAAATNNYYGGATTGYEQSYAQPYQAPWPYPPQPANYQHHAPWPNYPNYY